MQCCSVEEIGAVTHTTINGIYQGKFSRGTSHSGFRIPCFKRVQAISSSLDKKKKCDTFQYREIESQLLLFTEPAVLQCSRSRRFSPKLNKLSFNFPATTLGEISMLRCSLSKFTSGLVSVNSDI